MARSRKKLLVTESDEMKGWGIPLPATEVSMFRLYQFVKNGSRQWGKDEAERIEYAKIQSEHWTGKRVRGKGRRKDLPDGTVSYLVFRSRGGIQTIRMTHVVSAIANDFPIQVGVGPYQVAVLWDGSVGPSMNSPMSLELIPDNPPQAGS